MKKLLALMLMALVALSAAALAETYTFPATGFTYEAPEAYDELIGQLLEPSDRGEVTYKSGLFMGNVVYCARSNEEYEQLMAFEETADEEAIAAADQEFANGHMGEIFSVYGMSEDWTQERVIEAAYRDQDMVKDVVPLGSNDGLDYILVTANLENPTVKALVAEWPQEMIDEFIALEEDVAAHPERFTLIERQVFFAPPEAGSILSFEATDLDGNPVTSEELFAQSKVTMVNIWASWCVPCISEMPELDEIARQLKDEGLSVVTYCSDATSSEVIEKAREIVGAYSFTNLAASPSGKAALIARATPTSYFVDSEGRVLGDIVEGADMEGYARALNAYLGVEITVDEAEEAPEAEETPEAEEAGIATYTVSVVDQNGDPVKGVAVSFCTGATCSFAKSDAEGMIHFEGEPYAYHVDIVKVPAGYSFSPLDDVYTEDHSCGMTITVTKEM